MKKIFAKALLLTLALVLASASALAEGVELNGTVTAAYTVEIYAESSAVVEKVYVIPGQTVRAGDQIAALRTNKVYAEEDGVVSALFARPGDLTDTLVTRYGALGWLETDVLYTISASTGNAYDSVETKTVYPGETVAIKSRNDADQVGKGVIVALDGNNYTVHVTDGAFETGESVYIYRGEDYATTQRIGRGSITRNTPLAVSGTGRVVAVAVKAGQRVSRGDLLLETLAGSGTSAEITTDVSGVVAQVGVTQGAAAEENAVVAVIWPADAMQVELLVGEEDLASLAVGDPVNLSFDWNEAGTPVPGTVREIAAAADTDSTETMYKVYISFTPDETVRYGMNVTVTVAE